MPVFANLALTCRGVNRQLLFPAIRQGRGSQKRAWPEQEIATVLQFLGFLVSHSEFRAGDSA
jgi:hypothetical protein